MAALTEFPVCPHCSHAEHDAWEIDFGPGLDGNTEIECGSCGESYFAQRHCDVTYSTYPIKSTAATRPDAAGGEG